MKTNLAYIRMRCNYSQRMAAEEIGVARQQFCAWESGRKAIPAKRKAALAELFGVDIPDFDDLSRESLEEKYQKVTMFSQVRQGKQVFSFRPTENRVKIVFQDDTSPMPELRRKEIDKRRRDALERIRGAFSFVEGRQAEQLEEGELNARILERLSEVLAGGAGLAERQRSVAWALLLNTLDVLKLLFESGNGWELEAWERQLLGLLRSRWAEGLRECNDRIMKADVRELNWAGERWELIQQIEQLYWSSVHSGADRELLQWYINQYLGERGTI